MSDDPARTLFETFRVEEGRPVRIERHLARLERSARELGVPHDPARLRSRLRGLPLGTSRARLTLRPGGEVELDLEPLHGAASLGVLPVGWASEIVRSDDPARRHKSRDRAAYDRAARAARADGFADLIFVNERGELVEGAISTLFVELDGRVWTPPVAAGALPGVLREAWLERGFARERTLYPDDLLRAPRVWIGSSLRGARRVRPARPPG